MNSNSIVEQYSGSNGLGDSSPENGDGGIRRIVQRLHQLVEQETGHLRSSANVDFGLFSAQKSRLLLELSRASRGMGQEDLTGQLRAELAQLKAALNDNQNLIEAHLGAVREMSDIVVGAMKDQEADGTYGERF